MCDLDALAYGAGTAILLIILAWVGEGLIRLKDRWTRRRNWSG